MNIAELLIRDFDIKISEYFNPESREKWKKSYQAAMKNIDHEEPWLTLIACYAIFGDQTKMNDPETLIAINSILKNCGIKHGLVLDKNDSVRVEEKLPEILSYREYLKEALRQDNFHLYPDRRAIIEEKVQSKQAAFEGNTNLDLKITGQKEGVKKHLFVEAKFLSDISYQISYNPIRDQIIRNIDTGIDFMVKNRDIPEGSFKNFYFLLLTPKVFRPKEFGTQKKSGLDVFQPQKSRLYCYKMLEYKDYRNLRDALPHRSDLTDNQWKEIADNIGWIAFEDLFINATKYNTFSGTVEKQEILKFAVERNLYQT